MDSEDAQTALVRQESDLQAALRSALSLWADGDSQPYVSTLNSFDGSVTSNMAIIPMANGSVDAYASQPTHLVLDVAGYFAP